ncbi:MAG: hypothetical protein JWL83_2885 [Actinomycetia bacterium]|nr:hypothetical protein [Actinomycetes bacterium]
MTAASTSAPSNVSGPSDPSGHDAPGRAVPRWPLALVLAVLLVGAVIAGNGKSSATNGINAKRASAEGTPRDAAAIAGTGASSSAWYCPGPPPSPLLANASERLSVSNLEAKPVDVAVTVFGKKGLLTHSSLRAAARASTRIDPGKGVAENNAIIVEPFASRVAVEATSTGPNTFASAPCATQPSPVWNFASGTTVRGAEDWIVIFNPFGDDAVVDMSFFTNAGLERPSALQGMTIPRRSRIAIPVHDTERRQPFVATSITARTGRVVAQQTVLFGPETGFTGQTRSLGAIVAGNQWVFASGVTLPGVSRVIGISNPSDLDAQVDVQVAPMSNIVIEPITIAVPRQSAVNVQLGGCDAHSPPSCVRVPPNLAYSVVVRATHNVPVVAEDLTTSTSGRFRGAVAAMGGEAPSRTWVFARSRLTPEVRSQLDLLSTAGATVHADVSFVAGGKEVAPADLQHIVVRAGVPLTIALDTRPELNGIDAGVIVRADRPVFVERTILRLTGVSRGMGIPER